MTIIIDKCDSKNGIEKCKKYVIIYKTCRYFCIFRRSYAKMCSMISKQDLIAYRIKHGLPIPEYYSCSEAQLELYKSVITTPTPLADMPEKDRKRACRGITQRKVKRGELIKQPCVICGEKNVHAHHNDYTDPDKVVWLCPYHHYGLHYAESVPGSSESRFFKSLMDKNKPRT